MLRNIRRVTKLIANRTELEHRAEEGESPVSKSDEPLESHPSNAEHVKFRTNPGRPRSKAKHIQRPIENSTERER